MVYLELRTTPRPLPNKGISVERYVETVLSCIDAYNTDATTRLHTKLILSVDRRMTASQAQQVVNLAIQYRSRGVVGIDLAGDPAFGDVRIFAPAFVHAKMEGLKITLHFAEAPSVTDEELSTLLSWNPDRIGHVIHVKDEFKEMIVKQGVGVELCLSCNVHAKMLVGTSGNYSDHHFGEWKHEPVGVALSVSSFSDYEATKWADYRTPRRMTWASSAVPCRRSTTSRRSILVCRKTKFDGSAKVRFKLSSVERMKRRDYGHYTETGINGLHDGVTAHFGYSYMRCINYKKWIQDTYIE